MEVEGWRGLSVVYVTPLRALLNNLQPRVEAYCSWLGRRAATWHGDTGDGPRKRLLADPPDVLLTTPDSLEAMLVSARVDAHAMFADLQAVVVDEIHAFAGDDRGWHLLARLQVVAGRPLQRIGLSATVGNPQDLLGWLQSGGSAEPGIVAAPDAGGTPAGAEIAVDMAGRGTTGGRRTVVAVCRDGSLRCSKPLAEEPPCRTGILSTPTGSPETCELTTPRPACKRVRDNG